MLINCSALVRFKKLKRVEINNLKKFEKNSRRTFRYVNCQRRTFKSAQRNSINFEYV